MNVSSFEQELLRLERKHPEIGYILVKGSGINYLDASGVEMLSNLVLRFKNNNITLGFSGLKKQVREMMDRTALSETIGPDNIFATDREALEQLFLRGVIDSRIEQPVMEPELAAPAQREKPSITGEYATDGQA